MRSFLLMLLVVVFLASGSVFASEKSEQKTETMVSVDDILVLVQAEKMTALIEKALLGLEQMVNEDLPLIEKLVLEQMGREGYDITRRQPQDEQPSKEEVE